MNIGQLNKARETALKILYNVYEEGAYSNIALNKHLRSNNFSSQDRAFITELVYGVIKWQLKLDYVISKFSKVKLSKISPWIINILRLGVYQILFTDRIPESAACNESVKLSGRYGHKAAAGYVNGVLRNIARNKQYIEYPDPDKDVIEYLSVNHSHPEWMVKYWYDWFGSEFTEKLLMANNTVPELTIRANTLKISPSDLVEQLNKEGCEVSGGRYVEEALNLVGTVSITDLDAYKRGFFQVQDESSMLAVKVLDPKQGEFIADLCSAPGGKSTYIAQIMKDRGKIFARDIHAHKIKLVENAASLLGITCIEAEVHDSTQLDNRLINRMDRVLVDAPCTGLGIIRRKADIKWTRKPEDIKALNELQYKILNNAAQYLKPGGVLVYSTCTIQREENQGIVERFLKEHPDFIKEDPKAYLPGGLKDAADGRGYIQLYPHIHGVDGFFVARLKKN